MDAIITTRSATALALPAPRTAITIRAGTTDDLAFIDSLQRVHCRQLGWMPRAQLEGKIRLGHVIIAEDALRGAVGYCIGNDQYFKRDDVGIIYQLCVAPGQRRAFIGAALIKAMFDRAAYGCRLFCCWCAQDIEANRFWESMGFVPLAFRTGSRTKGKGGTARVHIFWQKRIRPGDEGVGATPWWFPAQTGGGSIREDRLVLPIGPGTHWSDAKPIVLPGAEHGAGRIEDKSGEPAPRRRAGKSKQRAPKPAVIRPATVAHGGMWVAPAPAAIVAPEEPAVPAARPKRAAIKNDPKLVAFARELRDRWLEEVAADPALLVPAGKYDATRSLPDAPPSAPAIATRVLPGPTHAAAA